MTATTLASYAITGRREIWPLFVVFGLLVLVITGLVIAQVTDPDRKHRAADRRALVAGIAAADAATAPADEKDGNEPAEPDVQVQDASEGDPTADLDVEVPKQDRRVD